MSDKLLRNFFDRPYTEQRKIRAGVTEWVTCKQCDGAGYVPEMVDHHCDCEYCEIAEEDETGRTIKCAACNGAGELIPDHKHAHAEALLRGEISYKQPERNRS